MYVIRIQLTLFITHTPLSVNIVQFCRVGRYSRVILAEFGLLFKGVVKFQKKEAEFDKFKQDLAFFLQNLVEFWQFAQISFAHWMQEN